MEAFIFDSRLNPVVLKKLFGNNYLYAKEAFYTYLEEVPKQIAQLEKDLEDNDYTSLYYTSHKLLNNIGAAGLTEAHSSMFRIYTMASLRRDINMIKQQFNLFKDLDRKFRPVVAADHDRLTDYLHSNTR